MNRIVHCWNFDFNLLMGIRGKQKIDFSFRLVAWEMYSLKHVNTGWRATRRNFEDYRKWKHNIILIWCDFRAAQRQTLRSIPSNCNTRAVLDLRVQSGLERCLPAKIRAFLRGSFVHHDSSEQHLSTTVHGTAEPSTNATGGKFRFDRHPVSLPTWSWG